MLLRALLTAARPTGPSSSPSSAKECLTRIPEKLFGAKADSSRADPSRVSSMDWTRRLFYVTCSRAENSLALIAYSADPAKVREHALSEEWFANSEIEMGDP